MSKYINGKIYKIESMNENQEEGDIYIGSSSRPYLCQRMGNHRADYRKWKKGTVTSYMTSFILFDKYGVDNCKITLLENFPCDSKDELLSREAFYIRKLKCVNKQIPLRTKKEWRMDNIEDVKKYFLMRNGIKVNCLCGSVHGVTKTFRHVRIQKHLKFLEEHINQTIIVIV